MAFHGLEARATFCGMGILPMIFHGLEARATRLRACRLGHRSDRRSAAGFVAGEVARWLSPATGIRQPTIKNQHQPQKFAALVRSTGT